MGLGPGSERALAGPGAARAARAPTLVPRWPGWGQRSRLRRDRSPPRWALMLAWPGPERALAGPGPAPSWPGYAAGAAPYGGATVAHDRDVRVGDAPTRRHARQGWARGGAARAAGPGLRPDGNHAAVGMYQRERRGERERERRNRDRKKKD